MKSFCLYKLLIISLLIVYSNLEAQNHYAKDNFQKGEIELHVGDFSEAVKYFNQAIGAFKNYAAAYYSRGKAHLFLKKYDSAIYDFTQLSQIDSNRADAYFYLGAIYYQTQTYEKSIQYLSRALQLDTNYALAYNYRAEGYQELGLTSFAVHDYTKAIHFATKEAILYFGRGKCHLALEKYPEAIQDFSKAISLEPRKAIYYQYRLETNFLAGNYTQTIQDIDYLLNLDEKNIEPHYYHLNAYCKAQNQDFAGAIVAMDKVLAVEKNQAQLFIERGTYYQKQKNLTKAIEDYQQAIVLNPQDTIHYELIAQLYFELEDFVHTIQYCNTVIETNPSLKIKPEIWYWRGFSHFKLNQKTEAKADLTQAILVGYPKNKIDKNALKLVKKANLSEKKKEENKNQPIN